MRWKTYFRIQGLKDIHWNWIRTEIIWNKIGENSFDQSWTKYWADLATASSETSMEKINLLETDLLINFKGKFGLTSFLVDASMSISNGSIMRLLNALRR